MQTVWILLSFLYAFIKKSTFYLIFELLKINKFFILQKDEGGFISFFYRMQFYCLKR